MASSSKPDLTNEEFDANRRLVDTYSGNGKGFVERGQQVNIDKFGNIVVGDDHADIYRFNDKTGDWRSHGGGIMTVREMPTAAPAPAPSDGGGGGGGGAPSNDWRKQVRPTENQQTQDQGKTTSDILGDTYTAMTEFQPQVGHLNALVDPNQWMTQVNPAMQTNYADPGVYVNPQIGMLQDTWSNTSTNPYSLLG